MNKVYKVDSYEKWIKEKQNKKVEMFGIKVWKFPEPFQDRYGFDENMWNSTDPYCYSFFRNKVLKKKISPNNVGYNALTVQKDGYIKTFLVHRIIVGELIQHFSEESNVVNHRDGNRLNNHPSNLELSDISHNVRHAIETGLMTYNKYFTEDETEKLMLDYINTTLSLEELAKRENCGLTTIFKFILTNEGYPKLFEKYKDKLEARKSKARDAEYKTWNKEAKYSTEFIIEIIDEYLGGLTQQEISDKYDIAQPTVKDLILGIKCNKRTQVPKGLYERVKEEANFRIKYNPDWRYRKDYKYADKSKLEYLFAYDKDWNYVGRYYSAKHATEELKINCEGVSRVLIGERNFCGGYRWEKKTIDD